MLKTYFLSYSRFFRGQKDGIDFIHECGNLKVFVDGGELTGYINK